MAGDQVVDRAVILAVHVHETTVRAGHFQHAQQPPVVDDLVTVGHVNLEGRKAIFNHDRHFTYHTFSNIRDDCVEAVVDDGVGIDLGEAAVPGHEQGLAAALEREVDDRGHAAASARDGTCEEVVGGGDSEAVDGVREVCVRVDPAGHDPVAACVDGAGGARAEGAVAAEVRPDSGDPTVTDEHVGKLHAVRGDDRAALDQELAHEPDVTSGLERTGPSMVSANSRIRSIASRISASGASSDTRTQLRQGSPKELPGNMSTPASSRRR